MQYKFDFQITASHTNEFMFEKIILNALICYFYFYYYYTSETKKKQKQTSYPSLTSTSKVHPIYDLQHTARQKGYHIFSVSKKVNNKIF